jgi:DNA-binding transcriptional LysR family regulator
MSASARARVRSARVAVQNCTVTSRTPKSDDLLVLLAVSRHRSYSAAAQHLGVDHTTVARRLSALASALGGRLLVEAHGGWDLTPLGQEAVNAALHVERALDMVRPDEGDVRRSRLRGVVRVSAPEVFVREVVAPAVAELCREHQELACELVSVTRPTPMQGPSSDLDIGVTRPGSKRVATRRLLDYELGLYASADYLAAHPPIRTRADLRYHAPVYYVESMLQVSDLDLVDQFFPRRPRLLGATHVSAQAALVLAGAGIGLLPTYYARHLPLEPVLDGEAVARLAYWMSARPDNLRRPEVTAVADAVHAKASALGVSGAS